MRKVILLVVSALLLSACAVKSGEAKYVFLFIGDGMGFTQVSTAEAYLSYSNGSNGSNEDESLVFTKFPVLGMASTHSASHSITCSSAAGTAISTGVKTNNSFLGVAPDSTNLRSIAYNISDHGYKVGIVSTVSLDHATPAAFYANSISRGNYYDIALQVASSGFDFFGGGGFIEPTSTNKDMPSAYDMAVNNGYSIAAGIMEFDSLKTNSEKIILLQDSGRESGALKYAIDMNEGDMMMSDLVHSAIKFLDNDKGFFIMAESGKIDWAGHANDAKSNILETIDLSSAVAIAYEFYLKYPEQTLIVVTSDHETGGMGMGTKGYSVNFDALAGISSSGSDANANSGIGWTTGGHTGAMVPVFAIGAQSSLFGGKMDNTEIYTKISAAMGLK